MSRKKNLPTWFSRRTLIIAMASVVGIGVLLAGWQFIAKIQVRNDYTAALAKTNTVVKTYNTVVKEIEAMANAASNRTATESDLQQSTDSYDEAVKHYTEAVVELQSERGVTRPNVAGTFNTFIDANKKFTAATSDRTTIVKAVFTTTHHCNAQTLGAMDTSDLTKLTEAYDKTFSPCVKGIEQLASAKNSEVAATGKRSKEYFDSLKTHVEAMQSNYQAGNRTQFESEYKAFLSLAESVPEHTNTTAVLVEYNKLLPGDQLTQLATLLAQEVKKS